jgi:hypothetical protein
MPRTFSPGRYWRGDGPLWRVYWLYGVAASGAVIGLIVVSVAMNWLSLGMLAVAVLATAVYAQWLIVSIWRCASNVRSDALGLPRQVWGLLARCLTLAWAAGVIGVATLLFHVVAASKG